MASQDGPVYPHKSALNFMLAFVHTNMNTVGRVADLDSLLCGSASHFKRTLATTCAMGYMTP